MKYRKKPVVIEAKQLTEENMMDIKEWCNGELIPNCPECRYDLAICTLEGVMQAGLGDYVIKGVKGEFYPCKQDVFEQTHEHVSQTEMAAVDLAKFANATGVPADAAARNIAENVKKIGLASKRVCKDCGCKMDKCAAGWKDQRKCCPDCKCTKGE